LYAALLKALLDFEQGMLIWRQRHARMVETFIGRRIGTGGSSGVDFLDATAVKYRVFQDMWRIRSLMMARSKLQYDPTAARKNIHADDNKLYTQAHVGRDNEAEDENDEHKQ